MDPAYQGLRDWERAGIRQDAIEDSREFIKAERNRDAVKDLCAEFARRMVDLAREREIDARVYVNDPQSSWLGRYRRVRADDATALRIAEDLFVNMVEDFDLPTGEEACGQ